MKNCHPFRRSHLRRGNFLRCAHQRHLRSGHRRGLRINHFDFEIGRCCGHREEQYQRNRARYAHTILLCTRKRLTVAERAGLLALRVRMNYKIQQRIRSSRDFPVAGGSFLAYSCAAARDFHPLPSLCRAAKTHAPNKFRKSRYNRPTNLIAQACGSQMLISPCRPNCRDADLNPTFSISRPHTTKSTAAGLAAVKSPAESKMWCSSPGRQCLPAAVPAADSFAPALPARFPPPAEPPRKKSAIYRNQSYWFIADNLP